MKPCISEFNRNKTFEEIRDTLPLERKKVLNVIKEYPHSTLVTISNLLNKGLNAISGRVTELKDQCLIKEVELKSVSGNKKRYTTYVSVDDEDERIDLINATMVELRDSKDQLINDLNIKELTEKAKEILRSEIKRISEKQRRLDEAF